MTEVSRNDALTYIVPIATVCVAAVALFWQQSNYLTGVQANYLSLREHIVYTEAAKRELENAKAAADSQRQVLQKDIDRIQQEIDDLRHQFKTPCETAGAGSKRT